MNLNTLNEHNIPLHACNGYRHDEHWWAWAKWVMETCQRLGSDGVKVYYKKLL